MADRPAYSSNGVDNTNGHKKFSVKMNGMEGKTPFLIGVAGGTASGKVNFLFT